MLLVSGALYLQEPIYETKLISATVFRQKFSRCYKVAGRFIGKILTIENKEFLIALDNLIPPAWRRLILFISASPKTTITR